ncbi:MAG: hypothetical protein EOP05_10470 [Proteobacteria bacterium]|nr:MAG: hypothetical protein EOP05_10470 [Pseudomonadota bacterium]
MKTRGLALTTLAAILASSLAPTLAWTKVEYDSEFLRMKNAEQVNALVIKKIKQAESVQKKQEVDDDLGIVAEPEAVEYLKDATLIVLSRPDQDGTRAIAFARLRRELSDLNSFDPVIQSVNKEAIEALKNKSTSVKDQATYIYVLENLMAELKPDLGSNSTYRKLVEDIRDAKIELTDKVKSQQRLRAMSNAVSPSKTAETILPKKK